MEAPRPHATLLAVWCATALTLASCGTTPISHPPAAALTPVPQVPALSKAEASHYLVRADLCDIRFLVFRAGPLAKLGHNHVIRARTVEGDVWYAKDFERSALRIRLPISGFEVDPADARAEEGSTFGDQPSEDAVTATRGNMLGSKMLDAERYPVVEIASVGLRGPQWAPDITLRIKLHGVERELSVPVALEAANERLSAIATFEIRQSDFGIAPFSVLGGGLQVADAVRVRIRIVAQRA